MTPGEIDTHRATFRQLHESGCFVLPNPWDIGTARYLQHLGFAALATTSAGVAFSQGLPDAAWAVPLDATLEHIAQIVQVADLPVNVDFESGYAHDPEGVATNVGRCVTTGVAGLSVEDLREGGRAPALYEFDEAVARVEAACAAVAGTGVVLTARSEVVALGADAIDESIRRLVAYAEAGADVLYAPGIHDPGDIADLVAAVAPKPVNVLMASDTGLRVGDLAALGVRRVSLGSALARSAWGGFVRAARLVADDGSFAGLDGAMPFAELNRFFTKDHRARSAAPGNP